MGKVPQGQAGVAATSEAELEVLVQRARAGDMAAWGKLWLALEPEVERAVARPRALGSLAGDQTEVDKVVDHVMGELHRDDFRLLGTLGERLAQRDGSWPRWLWTVSTNAARNHVRDHADCLGRDEEGNVRFTSYTELPDEIYDARADPSRYADAHRILDEAPAWLTAAQMDAVVDWLVGGPDTDERSRAQPGAGGDKKAERLVRAGIRKLRRRYAGEGSGSAPADAPAKARLSCRARTNR